MEYKESYASKIPDSVAAMANSYGGLILIGVTEQNVPDRLIGVPEPTIVQIVSGCVTRSWSRRACRRSSRCPCRRPTV